MLWILVKMYILSKIFNCFNGLWTPWTVFFCIVKWENTSKGMNGQFDRQSRLDVSPARKPRVLKRATGQSQHLNLLPVVTKACGFLTFSFVPENVCCCSFPGGFVSRTLFFLCVLSVHFVAWNTCSFVSCPHYRSWSPCPFSTDQIVCAAQRTSESLWKADLVKRQPGNCLAVNTHIKKLKLRTSPSLIFFFFAVTLFSWFFQTHSFFFKKKYIYIF